MPEPLASPEAEAALLGRLLLDPRQIPLVRLDPSDFFTPAHRDIFAAMQRLSADSRVVDVPTLAAEADPDVVEGLLLEAGPGRSAPIDSYVQLIARDSFRRKAIGTLSGVVGRIYQEEDQGQIKAMLQDAVAEVMAGAAEGKLKNPTSAVDAYELLLDERARGKKTGLSYGIHQLDDLIQPAGGGDMIVLAARPSVGKTTLAEVVADYWAQHRPPVLFASLEMSISQLLDRAIARRAGLDANRLIRGTIDRDQFELARSTAEARRGVQVWYLDDPFATTADVRAAAAQAKLLAGDLGAIVIDYLQLLKDPGDQEVQRVTRISRNVKAIAREFDVPVLVLSQLSRALEQRADKHPKLYDLRESGAIEQDADLVIGLHRPLGTTVLDLEVLKNRQGPLGMIQLYFDLDRVSVVDLSKEVTSVA